MRQKYAGCFYSGDKIRRHVFTAVARYAYQRDRDVDILRDFYAIPYQISPGETTYRDSVLVERGSPGNAPVLGMPLRPVNEYLDLATG